MNRAVAAFATAVLLTGAIPSHAADSVTNEAATAAEQTVATPHSATHEAMAADSATHAAATVAETVQPVTTELPVTPAARAMPANAWDGPMRTHTTSPFHMLRPSSTTLTPPGNRDVLATRLDVDVTWGNIWIYSPDVYRFDGEWIWARLSAQQQFGRASLRLTATAISRSGGVLDSLVETFHRQIGQGEGSRTDFPRGKTVLSVGADGSLFDVEGPSRRLGDTSVAFAWTLMEPNGSRPSVSTELIASFPTGDPDELAGLGGALYGVGLLARQPVGNSGVAGYAGVLASYTTADALAGLSLYPHAVSRTLGVEYAWNSRWSGLVQYLGDSAAVKDARELSSSMHELAVGVRRRGAGRTTIEATVVENLARFGNSADIELHAGLRHTF